MRARKKRHQEERLERCKSCLLQVTYGEWDPRKACQVKEYFDYEALFGNNNPVELEIGCGKGGFAVEWAKRNPDKNLLAVERSRNVLVDACEKAMAEGVTNLKFLLCDAEYLPKYLPEHSVNRLYLNFSCPFPKRSYENRRLTNIRFLEIYKRLLAKDAEIWQKTDNLPFFEYSLEQYQAGGYQVKNVCRDLYASPMPENIPTEYETRFASMGLPIYRVEAYWRE